MGSPLVSWTSKSKMLSLALLLNKFHALSYTIVEVTWMKKLCAELQLESTNPPLIFCDNVSTSHLAKHPALHALSYKACGN